MGDKNRQQQKTQKPKKKKLSKKAKRGRRIRIAIVALPVVIVVLAVAALIGSAVLFRVEGFSLGGEGRYSKDEIVNASGIDVGDCLMWINLNKAEDRITKTLPYIESVTIKRKLPHTVSIEYKQAKVFYGVCIDGTWALTDTKYKVVELLDSEPKTAAQKIKLPKAAVFEVGSVIGFDVKDGEESPLDIYKKLMAEAGKTSLKGKITGADVSDPAALSLIYDGRITIKLGAFANISDKLKLSAGAIANEDRVDSTERGTLDASVTDRAYFRPDSKLEPASEEQTTEISAEQAVE